MVPRPIRLTSKPERPKCAYVIPSLMSRLYERRCDPVLVAALALFAVVNRPDASLLQDASWRSARYSRESLGWYGLRV
jgi:hypothetical protein